MILKCFFFRDLICMSHRVLFFLGKNLENQISVAPGALFYGFVDAVT